MASLSKGREAQKAITDIKFYEGWNAEVSRNMYNKNISVKISNISKHKQEQKKNTKRTAKKRIGKTEK